MSCPDLTTLCRAMDLDPGEPEARAVQEHLLRCARCEEQVAALHDIEAVLSEGATWSAVVAPACLSEHDLLRAASGEESPAAERHARTCAACRADVLALSEALLAPPEPLHDGLRRRLRGLVPRGSTTEELDPVPAASPPRRRSERTTRRSKRRPAVRSLRGPRVQQPMWAWGALASAAALLVLIALLAPGPGPRRDVADQGGGDPQRSGQLVSDLLAQPRAAQGERAGAPADRVAPSPEPERAAERGPSAEEARRDPRFELPELARAERPSPRAAGDEGLVDRPRAGTTTRGEAADAGDPSRAGDPAAPARPEPAIVDDGGRLMLALARLGGQVGLRRGDGEWRRLRAGPGELELMPGDRLRSTKAGAFLSLEDGAFELCLARDTELVVRGASAGPILGLAQGKLLCEVATLPPDRRFEVRTSDGAFSVLGTVFAVEAGAADSRLLVSEGTVEVTNPHGQVRVPAGRATRVGADRAPAAPEAFDARELAWTRALAPRRQIVYRAEFEGKNLAGFVGELSQAHTPRGGSALLLSPLPDNRYWGLGAHVPSGHMSGFRADADTYLQFSVFCEQPTAVLIQANNQSQGKQFKQQLAHPGGFWRTFTVPLLELSTYFDPGENPVRVGDLFVDLQVYAGKPGATGPVLLDDVLIYRKLYR